MKKLERDIVQFGYFLFCIPILIICGLGLAISKINVSLLKILLWLLFGKKVFKDKLRDSA